MLVYLHIHTYIYSWKRESIFTRKNASPTPIAINKYTNICWNISTQTHITACIGIRPQYYLSSKQRFEWKRTYLHSDIIRQSRYTAVWCPPVQRCFFFFIEERNRGIGSFWNIQILCKGVYGDPLELEELGGRYQIFADKAKDKIGNGKCIG